MRVKKATKTTYNIYKFLEDKGCLENDIYITNAEISFRTHYSESCISNHLSWLRRNNYVKLTIFERAFKSQKRSIKIIKQLKKESYD